MSPSKAKSSIKPTKKMIKSQSKFRLKKIMKKFLNFSQHLLLKKLILKKRQQMKENSLSK